jgi:hypothetical protein
MRLFGYSTWWWYVTGIDLELSTIRFLHDSSDPDAKALELGVIKTIPTGWTIGKSNQNNCYNMHRRGAILAFDEGETIVDPGAFGGFVHVIKDLYFNYIIDMDDMFTFIEYGTIEGSSGTVDHMRCCCINLRVGEYCILLRNETTTVHEKDGIFQPNVDHVRIFPQWTFLRPTAEGMDLGDQYWKPNYQTPVEYEMDWVAMSFKLISLPSESELLTDYAKWLIWHGRGGGYTTSVSLIQPPLAGPENLNWSISYDLDSAMAEALSSQVDFTTSNGIAYGLDAKEIISTAKADLSNLEALAKGAPGKLKIASKLFLSVHYGWKLLAADTKEFAEAFGEFSRTSTRRVHFSVSGHYPNDQIGGYVLKSAIAHRSIYYDPYGQISNSAFALAEAMDVVPDLSNIWDMIPFSFVVDWFTNIGDLAEGLDALMTLVQEHKVLGTITSTKEVYEYHVVGGFGSYEYTVYNRSCVPDWYPLPEFSFQLKNPLTNLTHWCEAGALVVATRP